MRDYVYLLKYLASSVPKGARFGLNEVKKAIEINFGTSHSDHLPKIIKIFFENISRELSQLHHLGGWVAKGRLIDDVSPTPSKVEDILASSYGRYTKDNQSRLRPRFKILIDPSDTYCMSDDAIKNVESAYEAKDNIIHITVSDLEGDRKRSFEAKVLAQLRLAMESGKHVVIRNPERLLSYLFDVLNLNYTAFVNNKGETIERAIVALGAETDLFDIHPLFLITFLFSEKAIKRMEKTNIPFLSRNEKYLLRIDFDGTLCEPVTKFTEYLGTHHINMFHPQLTVTSAITSAGPTHSPLTSDIIFAANCQILSLVPPSAFVRLCPKLVRRTEYTKAYLAQNHFDLNKLIRSAAMGTCTLVTTGDTLSLHSIAKEFPEDIIIDIDAALSHVEITAKIKSANTVDSKTNVTSPIILVVASQRRKNEAFMWYLRNEVTTYSAQSNRPHILLCGAPCHVTAKFSDKWHYLYLDTCRSSKIAQTLLHTYLSANDSVSEPRQDDPVNQTVDNSLIEEILEIFVSSHRAATNTHYSISVKPLLELNDCLEKIPSLKNELRVALSRGLEARQVDKLILDSVDESIGHVHPFMHILHRRSNDAFLEAAKPLLRLIAGSCLIDQKERERYNPLPNNPHVQKLNAAIGMYRAYCESNDMMLGVIGYPERGAFRHPLSSFLFPIIWHRVKVVMSETQPINAPLEQNKVDEWTIDVLEKCLAALHQSMDEIIGETDKSLLDMILLDIFQQCDLLSNVNVKNDTYEKSVLCAMKTLMRNLCYGKQDNEEEPNRDPMSELVFAVIVLWPDNQRLRQGLMTSIFLEFLKLTSAIDVGKIASTTIANQIAKSISNALKQSDKTNSDLCYGLSLLFSFLFRTQSSSGSHISNLRDTEKLTVVAMLTELENTIVNRPSAPEERQALINFRSNKKFCLEVLDQQHSALSSQELPISSLTWYFAGLFDQKEEGNSNQLIEARIEDLKYWVANIADVERPLFWPVCDLLIEALWEAAAPTHRIKEDDAFLNTARACEALVDALPAELCKGLKSLELENALEMFQSSDNTTIAKIKCLLLSKMTCRIVTVLSFKSVETAIRHISTYFESVASPKGIVAAALINAICVTISDPSKYTAKDVMGYVHRLTISTPLPFYQENLPSNQFPTLLLLAHYTRMRTLDEARNLVSHGIKSENPIKLFQIWQIQAQNECVAPLLLGVPASIRDDPLYQSVKERIHRGDHQFDFNDRRYLLHVLREEIFLGRNPQTRDMFSSIRRSAANWGSLSLKVFDLLMTPHKDLLNFLSKAMNVDVEALKKIFNPPRNATQIDQAVVFASFLMVEVCSQADENNFWRALLLTPDIFNDKHSLMDMISTRKPNYEGDCNADSEANIESRIAIPDLAQQHTVQALLHVGTLSAWLLNPSYAGCERNLDRLEEILKACAQHLVELSQIRHYNHQSLTLHILSTFLGTIKDPPPVQWDGMEDEAKHRGKLLSCIPETDSIILELLTFNVPQANQEWEKKTLALTSKLPGVDLPYRQGHSKKRNNLMSLLEEYGNTLAIAQTAPCIARLYAAINESSPKISFESDEQWENRASLAQVSKRLGQSGKKHVEEGILAFNSLLDLNDGQLLVGCKSVKMEKIDKNTDLSTYVTWDKESCPSATDEEREGILLHALTTISKKIPSIEKLKGQLCEEGICNRICDLGKMGPVSRGASLWAIGKSSSTSRETLRDAEYKVLKTFCEMVTDDSFGSAQAAIANLFILPTMQMQIDNSCLRTIFKRQNSKDDHSNVNVKLNDLEVQVEILVTARLEEPQFKEQSWPHKNISLWEFQGLVENSLLTSEHRLNFFLQAYETLKASATPIDQEVSFLKNFGHPINLLHLPLVLKGLLNPYLRDAIAHLPTSFHENLPKSTQDGIVQSLTSPSQQPIQERIENLTNAAECIISACNSNRYQPSHPLSKLLQELGIELEIPESDIQPILLRNSAHVVAIFKKIVAEDYERDHEKKRREQMYDLDNRN